MTFEVSDRTQTMLDTINEFLDKELIPMERELFEKDPAEMESIVE